METELKLDLAAADADRLAASQLLGGEPAVQMLSATYFDTADLALQRAGLSLRVRHDGRRHVQTVKADAGAAAGLFVRPEWEREVPDAVPVLDDYGPLAPVLKGQAVTAQFSTQVSRRVWTVAHDGAGVEVALDRGTVLAGERAESFAELELELRDGSPAALFSLARALAEAAPLRLGVLSKSARGFRLAAGRAGQAAKADAIRLDADGTPAEALVAIAHACLRQFRLNEALLLAGDTAPAPLHQARVGLRRLRSALTLFKPLLAGDATAARLAAELRTLAAALGEVRDLDVLIGGHDGPARERLQDARTQAFAVLRARLEAPETGRLMLDLAQWLAAGDWRRRDGEEELRPFAADLLTKRRRRVKRRGAHLADLDDHHLHQVRIEAKKLRYAAEFFAGLWKGKEARRRSGDFLDAVEALQEDLGHLNDAATAPLVLERLGLPALPVVHDRAHLLRQAGRHHRRLLDAKRFWR